MDKAQSVRYARRGDGQLLDGDAQFRLCVLLQPFVDGYVLGSPTGDDGVRQLQSRVCAMLLDSKGTRILLELLFSAACRVRTRLERCSIR